MAEFLGNIIHSSSAVSLIWSVEKQPWQITASLGFDNPVIQQKQIPQVTGLNLNSAAEIELVTYNHGKTCN